jgi:hypothetical protein
MRALDTAAAQLEAPAPGTPWKGIGAFSTAKLSAYRGGDLMRLHRYAEAQAQLLLALDQLDPVFAKHRCTAHIDLAAAYMATVHFTGAAEGISEISRLLGLS